MEYTIVPEFEDDDDEFRSCCGDEDELEEIVKLGLKNGDYERDEFSVRMLFKGVSISESGNNGLGFSGIGVTMERSNEVIRVQKKLDFFVDEQVADYLALMAALSEAIQNNVKIVYAFTNSQILFDQITNKEILENQLLMALKQRIQQHIKHLEHFDLKCVLDINLESPLHLAHLAIGIVHDSKNDPTVENCLICSIDKPTSMMVTLKCSHKFCSHCIKEYVDEKVRLSEVPIRCPSQNCRYYISTPEHKSFLTVATFMLLEKADLEPTDKFYCPFFNCSILLDPSCNLDSTNNCVECPVCTRFICVKCGVRWHSSMSCDEFREVSMDGEEQNDQLTLTGSDPRQEFEEWAWDSFGSVSNMMDAYSEEERSQLALIQRILAGGFSLSDHNTDPPCLSTDDNDDDSWYIDNTIKDLHQLPWLEQFVSVISDNYYDE